MNDAGWLVVIADSNECIKTLVKAHHDTDDDGTIQLTNATT